MSRRRDRRNVTQATENAEMDLEKEEGAEERDEAESQEENLFKMDASLYPTFAWDLESIQKEQTHIFLSWPHIRNLKENSSLYNGSLIYITDDEYRMLCTIELSDDGGVMAELHRDTLENVVVNGDEQLA